MSISRGAASQAVRGFFQFFLRPGETDRADSALTGKYQKLVDIVAQPFDLCCQFSQSVVVDDLSVNGTEDNVVG